MTTNGFEVVDGMRVWSDYKFEARLKRIATVIRDIYQYEHEGEPMMPTDVDFSIARAVIALPCECWACNRAHSLAE